MEITAALAEIQPDDEFYTPTYTHKHTIYDKNRYTQKEKMSKRVKISVHRHMAAASTNSALSSMMYMN